MGVPAPPAVLPVWPIPAYPGILIGMDQYLPLADAARAMHLSPLAVRKRCQRGTLDARKAHGEWHVRVPVQDEPPPVGGRDQSAPVARDGLGRPIPASQVDTDRDGTVAQTGPLTGVAGVDQSVTLALVDAWRAQLTAERERASMAEQAAAMWQERSRNLEAENGRLQELLALPAHEEPEPVRRWWQFLRKRG